MAQTRGAMRAKTLGTSDLKVSVLGIGGNSFGAPPERRKSTAMFVMARTPIGSALSSP